jgi:hypothetical protein
MYISTIFVLMHNFHEISAGFINFYIHHIIFKIFKYVENEIQIKGAYAPRSQNHVRIISYN